MEAMTGHRQGPDELDYYKYLFAKVVSLYGYYLRLTSALCKNLFFVWFVLFVKTTKRAQERRHMGR